MSRAWRVDAILVAAVAAAHLALAVPSGVSLSPDAMTFSGWADRLIAFHFHYGSFLESFGPRNVPPVLYAFHVTGVAAAKLLLGAKWPYALVACNAVCDVITAVILIRLARVVTRSSLGPVVAAVFYAFAFDIGQWVVYPVTDVPFLAMSFAAFSVLPMATLGRGQISRSDVVRALLLTLLTLLLRPVGFLWFPLIVSSAVLLSRESKQGDGIKQFARLALFTIVLTVTVVVLHSVIVARPERWPMRALSSSVRWDAKHYRAGEVVYQRFETYHRPPVTLTDHAAITADRFAHFFAITAAGLSRPHKLYAMAYYVPLYVLALIGVLLAARSDGAAAVVILCSALVVFSIALWHALVAVDFDWRYRLPVMPHLILLATFGATTVARSFVTTVSVDQQEREQGRGDHTADVGAAHRCTDVQTIESDVVKRRANLMARTTYVDRE